MWGINQIKYNSLCTVSNIYQLLINTSIIMEEKIIWDGTIYKASHSHESLAYVWPD